MPEHKLQTETRDGVLTLTLNRPAKLNAIDNELAINLLHALETSGSDDSVRAVRLRGNGRAFCSGRDLGAAPTEDDLALVQAVSTAIVHHPKTVVAEVHGWVVGAGLEWMLNADVVVAAESARFKLPEASLGVFVTGGLTATLTATVGLARAKALSLLGEVFTARQAFDWGMIWSVVANEELEQAAGRIAAKLASIEPPVTEQFKRVFNLIGLQMFDQAVEEEIRSQRLLTQRHVERG